jgi:hypothetical protein
VIQNQQEGDENLQGHRASLVRGGVFQESWRDCSTGLLRGST